jgi:3-oxoacyl-[acyl-carrier protein] reductase
MKIEGRSILLTGASRGIGAALAPALARAGADLTLLARSEAALADVARAVEAARGRVVTVAGSVTEPADVARAVREAQRAFGGLGGVINNAGFLGARVRFDDYPVEDLRASLEINAVGAFLLTQACMPLLRAASDGFVVNISSYLGRHGLPDAVGYIAGKFALEGITQALASEVTALPLAVVSLSPGMIATDMLSAYLGESGLEGYRSPESAAAALVDLLASLSPKDNGAQLELA